MPGPAISDMIFRRLLGKAKLRHVQLLVRLYELGNMKKAAEAMRISQPAVSLMVSELEALLELRLFQRHSRGVTPTQVTTELMPVARRILAAVGEGAEIISNVVNERDGVVRVAGTPAAVSALLYPAIRQIAQKHPRVHVDMSEVAAEKTMQIVADKLCDILCLRKPETIPEGWSFEECCGDALVVVCGKNHPLAGVGRATLDDLAKTRWIVTRNGSTARERFDSLCDHFDLPVHNRCEVITHVRMLTIALLSNPGYMCFVPYSVSIPWIQSGLAVRLESPLTDELAPLGYIWQENTSRKAVRIIAAQIRASAGA